MVSKIKDTYKTVTATYKIVTPMFVSGADSEKADLRIPSIKGAIRFWWRALNWDGTKCSENNCCAKENANKNTCQCSCTEDLYKREAAIFGSSDSDIGQSKVLFNLSSKNNIQKNSNYIQNYSNYTSIKYLAGQSVENSTPYINGGTFVLMVVSKNKIDETVIDAIKLWGLVGGLGQRSRKGFGSVAIQSLKKDDKEILNYNKLSQDKYKQEIENLIKNSVAFRNNNCPPYSAFSKNAEIHLADALQDLKSTHSTLGNSYKKFRGDENKSKDQRKAFGKPVRFGGDIPNSTDDRRASPVFLHIHPVKEDGQEKHIGVRLYLPATDIQHPKLIKQFLEDGTDLLELS